MLHHAHEQTVPAKRIQMNQQICINEPSSQAHFVLSMIFMPQSTLCGSLCTVLSMYHLSYVESLLVHVMSPGERFHKIIVIGRSKDLF